MRLELRHLPDSDLSPNKRQHPMASYKAKRVAKDEAILLVKEQGVPPEAFQRAVIDITFIAADKRRRDPDNLFASCKAYIDGLVEAGLIKDDSADVVSYSIHYERGTTANTIIEVREV